MMRPTPRPRINPPLVALRPHQDRVIATEPTAADLSIAEMTVKVHRVQAMAKMGVRSVDEMVHMAERVGQGPDLLPRAL